MITEPNAAMDGKYGNISSWQLDHSEELNPRTEVAPTVAMFMRQRVTEALSNSLPLLSRVSEIIMSQRTATLSRDSIKDILDRSGDVDEAIRDICLPGFEHSVHFSAIIDVVHEFKLDQIAIDFAMIPKTLSEFTNSVQILSSIEATLKSELGLSVEELESISDDQNQLSAKLANQLERYFSGRRSYFTSSPKYAKKISGLAVSLRELSDQLEKQSAQVKSLRRAVEAVANELGVLREHATSLIDTLGNWCPRGTAVRDSEPLITVRSTGLRASELASLTPAHFDLDADVPIVRIHAENEKARRGDVIPLPTGLVEMLRPWFQGMLKKALLWPGKWASQKRAGKTMQLDLENARAQWIKDAPSEAEKQEREQSPVLEFRTEVGQADFHALRHTYLSRLGRSGVSAKAMQKLARHSTVELTIGRYTHTNINDLGSAVQQMIPLPLTGSTGQTTQPNGSSGQSLVALMVAGFSDSHSKSVRTADDRPPTDEPVKPENTDSRNPCQRKTLDKDCGCLSALDKAERQGNAAKVIVTRFLHGTCDVCPKWQIVCEFIQNNSTSRPFL